MLITRKRGLRALLLVSTASLISGAAFAVTALPTDQGNLTISTTGYNTPDAISGTDQVTITGSGTVTAPTGTNMFEFTGATTTATLTNNGAITDNVAPITVNGFTGGTITVVNSGSITDSGSSPALGLGGLVAGTNIVINNSGTIATNTPLMGAIFNSQTNSSQVVPYLPDAIITTGSGGTAATNTTLTNSGTINGRIDLGAGTNVIDLVTGENLYGGINGLASTNNTMNLSGSGSGIVLGSSETVVSPVTPATNYYTFYGIDGVTTTNVLGGNWTLVGGAYWPNLNISQGATLNVCVAAVLLTCAPGFSQSTATGVPTDGGIGVDSGTFTLVNNGTLNIFDSDTNIYFDPTIPSPITDAWSGTGSIVLTGTGTHYVSPLDTITQGSIEINGGTLIVAGTVNSAVQIDNLSTLDIGSGGHLTDTDNKTPDNGTTGIVTGNITDNGTLNLNTNALTTTTLSGSITGSGAVNVNGPFTLSGASLTWAGATTINSGGVLIVTGGGTSASALTSPTTAIADNGSLQLNMSGGYTQSGSITGSGNLAYNPAGAASTIIITGTDSVSGIASFGPANSASILQLGNNTASGTITASSLAISGTLQFDRSDNIFTFGTLITDNGAPGSISQIGNDEVILSNAGNTFTGNVTVMGGTLESASLFKLNGANSITVGTYGTLAEDGATSPIIDFTAGGSTLTNHGTISGANTSGALINATGFTTAGSITVVNTGSITTTTNGGLLGLGQAVAGSTININNSGTIGDTGMVMQAISINGGPTQMVAEIPTVISTGASNATITNSGTIRGNIVLGAGTNVINLVTGESIYGRVDGYASSNNTVNLSGSGSGIVLGSSETPINSVNAATSYFTFYGMDNIQTMNVNSGTWSLVGSGYYQNLNIAQGAVFNVCADGVTATCATGYTQASPGGLPTDGGIGPDSGTFTVVNNGTLNVFSSDTSVDYSPGSTDAISGTGSIVFNGTGTHYFAPADVVTQGSIEINGGTLIDAGTINAAVKIDASSELDIGSGHTTAPDTNITGVVNGNITDNGLLVLNTASGFTGLSGNITGSGSVTVNGAFALSGANLSWGGGTTVNGALLIGSGAAAATSGAIGSGNFSLGTNGSIEFDIGSGLTPSGSYTLAGNITGTGAGVSYDVTGGPTIIISGTESYTGSTDFDPDTAAGTLQIGNGTTGSISSTSSMAIFGTLAFDLPGTYTFAAPITNEFGQTGSVAQLGSGTTILSSTASTFTGNVTVSSGKLESATSFKLNGSNNITIASGATLAEDGTDVPIVSFTGTPTGSTLNNAGTISGTTGGLIDGVGFTSGTINIINTGTITTTGASTIITLSKTTALPAGANVVINNSGTIGNTGVTTTTAFNPQTQTTQQVAVIPAVISVGGAANTTFTNSGTINGDVILGSGTNVINLVTGETINGQVDGLFSTSNTVNLSGTGSGVMLGSSEGDFGTTVTSTTRDLSFYGIDGVQTLNVNSGTWSLVGEGDYTNINIAAGATFNVCNDGVTATCATGFTQAPGSGGLSPLTNAGMIVTDNGTAVNQTNEQNTLQSGGGDPPLITLKGTGTFEQKGTGGIIFAPSANLTGFTGTFQIDTGSKIQIDTVAASNVNISSGATLQIGNGAVITDAGNTVIDTGASGDVQGAVVDNGTLIFDRLDDFNFSANLSGNGSIIKDNSDTVTLTGIYTFAGTTTINGGKVNVLGALSSASTLNLSSGTVNLGGTSQTIGGLSGGSGGTINLGGGTLTIDESQGGTFSGTITGSGTVVIDGANGATLVLNGNNGSFTGATTIASGALQIGSSTSPTASFGGTVTIGSGGSLEVGDINSPGATLNGTVTITPGGSLSGHGTINGSAINSGTTSPGGSIGTLSVTGNYTIASGGTFADQVAANGTASLLQVSGKVTIGTNTAAIIEPASALSTFARVTNYTVITGGTGVSGTFTSVSSSVAGFTPVLSYTGNAVNVALVRNDISLGTLASNVNQNNAGVAVSAGNGAVFAAIAPQADAVVRAALSQEDGEIHTSTASALLETDDLISSAINERGMADGVAIWGQEDGGSTHFRASTYSVAARDALWGFTGGVDMPVGDNLRAGVAVGYDSDKVNLTGQAANANVNSLMLGGYLKAAFGAASLTAGIDYAWHNISTQRLVQFASTSEGETAKYRDNSLNLFGEAAYHVDLGDMAYAAPVMDLNWSRLDMAAFQESGGSLALGQAAATSRSVTFATFGLRAGKGFDVMGGSLTPHVLAGWEVANGDLTAGDKFTLTNGSSFNGYGAPLAAGSFKAEAGVTLALGRFDLDLLYTGRFAGRANQNAADAKLEFHF